jgi:hypothetical protein
LVQANETVPLKKNGKFTSMSDNCRTSKTPPKMNFVIDLKRILAEVKRVFQDAIQIMLRGQFM